MSQLSELLIKKAEEIRLSSATEVAVDLIKKAGYSDTDARLMVAQHEMEKEACNTLVQAGVDVEKAVSMVKAANIKIKDLKHFSIASPSENESAELLKSAAAVIDGFERELHEKELELEKAASYKPTPEIKLPEHIEKVATSGVFTAKDLEDLKNMDQDLLNKVASIMEEPWEMGRGSGMARPKTDPMLEFILGGS